MEDFSQISNLVEINEDSRVFSAFIELQTAMKSRELVINPIHFVRTIHRVAHIKGRDLFTGWAQNDLHEFLLFMIECMHNSKKRPMKIRLAGTVSNKIDELALKCYAMLKQHYEAGDYSEISDLFNGVCVSRLFTIDGKHLHLTRPEIYSVLDLPIPVSKSNLHLTGPLHLPGPLHLTDCFDAFVADEVLHDWKNETSKQTESVKKNLAFWNFPKILIIALKRYSPDGKWKNNTLVDFPIDHLDLSKYAIGYKSTTYHYKLFGVANHMGGVNGGHYTAFVNCSSHASNSKWMCCNDSTVSEIDKSCIVSSSAYCLFYRKIDESVHYDP
jgi:ubiquitin C-terminal hydrolase